MDEDPGTNAALYHPGKRLSRLGFLSILPAVASPAESREPRRIQAMFGAIAGRYDALNHLLSLNLDGVWRRRAAEAACPEPGLRVLDLCGGTGDLSIALLRSKNPPAVVSCCDFSRPMLERAASKLDKRGLSGSAQTIEGDALRLPFADSAFDAVTVAFGVRNLADMRAGLFEMSRVLVPGGRLVILEFSRPSGPVLSRLYSFYLRQVVPRLGDGASGTTGPYRYLARTIADFPEPDMLAGVVRESGFGAVGWQPLSGGIVCLHTAFK